MCVLPNMFRKSKFFLETFCDDSQMFTDQWTLCKETTGGRMIVIFDLKIPHKPEILTDVSLFLRILD